MTYPSKSGRLRALRRRRPLANPNSLFAFEALEPRTLLDGSGALLATGDEPLTPDVQELCASSDGSGTLAVDVFELPQAEATVDSASGFAVSSFALSAVPQLSSKPDAAATLYLDFNGHFEAQWGAYQSVSTPAFDRDGDASSFSSYELSTISQVWERVAEDFSVFDLNVTTVEPSSFANGVALRVSIGGDGSWIGPYGGIAYVDSFTSYLPNTVFVFAKNLGNGAARYVADAVGHESGHAFGLQHHSAYDSSGTKTQEYDSGTSYQAPLMGYAYSATLSTWTNGTSVSATTLQDDIAVIARAANGFGLRPDDHGNSLAAATPVTVAQDGVTVTASGIIGAASDVDYFSFTTAEGEIDLAVDVAVGANLDTIVQLYDSSGTLLASVAPTGQLGAEITADLNYGTYWVAVRSVGSYGIVGQYQISGTIQDPNAPLPQPTLLGPVGSTSDTTPTIAWEGDSGVDYYTLYVSNQSTGQTVVANLALADTSFTPSDEWSAGQYTAWVKSNNNVGQTSDWSDPIEFTLSIATEASAATGPSSVGVHRGAAWYLDADNSQKANADADEYFFLGLVGDDPLVGDWNGDGVDEVGVHRGTAWYLDMDGNQRWNASIDVYFNFGLAGDDPLVGDWNGDGMDEVGVHRGNMWFLDTDGNRKWSVAGDEYFAFGIAGDEPLVGDWNGDGTDEVGLHRGSMWYLDTTGNGKWDAGLDEYFAFGVFGDEPLVGDWNNDGTDDVGVHRGNKWYLDMNGNRKWNVDVDEYFTFGIAGDKPVIGCWRVAQAAPVPSASASVGDLEASSTPVEAAIDAILADLL